MDGANRFPTDRSRFSICYRNTTMLDADMSGTFSSLSMVTVLLQAKLWSFNTTATIGTVATGSAAIAW